jgi:hypothetical protein
MWCAGFEKQNVRFTIGVAEDLTPLNEALWRLLFLGIGLSVLGALTVLLAQRWLLRRGFGQVSAVRRDGRRREAVKSRKPA